MRPWQGWFRRKRKFEEELSEELRFHVERQTAANIAAGIPAEEARREAVLQLGAVEGVKENCREERRGFWLETLSTDARYGFRMLRRNPGFTTVAVITLALGIGANTAIFSFVDAIMLRSLPVRDPQRLVVFNWTAREKPKIHDRSDYGDCGSDDAEKMDCSFSVPFFETIRERATTFSGVAAFAGPLEMDVSGNGPASIGRGEFVSGDFFPTLDVGTIAGRPLGVLDDTRSAAPAIVLDYGYWQRAFGGAPSAVGRAVRLNNAAALIVGVADPHFTNVTPGKTCDFYLPFSLADRVRSEWWGGNDRVSDPLTWWVVIVGRLKPGVSISEAQAAATTIFRNETVHGAPAVSKEGDAPSILLLPASRGLNGETAQVAPMFYLLMTAVGFVLVIACANVAGLMLARSATRQKEMAVRLALGAGRVRIVRQLLTESVMLSTLGGGLGVLVAIWGVGAITGLISGAYDRVFPFKVTPDWRVLAFTLAITFLTGILFGLAPAMRGTRVNLAPALKENAPTLPAEKDIVRRFRLSDALVVAQVALSIVVLVGAGLLVRTLRNLHTLNPGFDTRNILLFGLNPTIAGYDDQHSAQLYGDLQERLAATPGVLAVSYSEDALLSGGMSGDHVHLDDAPPKANIKVDTLAVGLDFFTAMRIPLLSGRALTPEDFRSAGVTNAAMKRAAETASSGSSSEAKSPATPNKFEPVAPIPVLINEMFARKYFPKADPVGKHMGFRQGDEPAAGPQPGYMIVGVVENTKYSSLRRAIEPTMYLPLVANSAHFEMRTAGDPTALISAVRKIVSQFDTNLPVFDIRTQTEQIERMLYQERLMTRLSTFFGLLALALACIGLYGLLAYEVARRTREIGIRLALGAQSRDVVRLVVTQGIVLALAGVTMGIAAAMGVTRFMKSMFFGVSATDPVTFVAVPALLAAVALLASYLPARRAMRVDPMVALRYE